LPQYLNNQLQEILPPSTNTMEKDGLTNAYNK